MTLKMSTGLAKWLLSQGNAREAFQGGRVDVYGGASAPATADDAVTGTKLYSLTGAAAVVKAKQKTRVTPTPGSAAAAEWNVKLNGQTVTFVDDGTPSIAEVCTGLYNAIRAASGVTSITTPASKLNIPQIYQKFTLTDNGTSLDIEAATNGVPFDIEVSVSGAGAGTGALALSTVTADAYGLQFEVAGDVTAGALEKLASQELAGIVAVAGQPTYYRLVQDADTGLSSTTFPRLQGNVSTNPGSDMTITHSNVGVGDRVSAPTTVKFKLPIT